MSGRTCYLHVGTGKTGTTAIQYALARAGDHLSAHGYDYPDFSGNLRAAWSGAITPGNGAILFKKLWKDDVAGAAEILQREGSGSGAMIVSCEGFWQVKKDVLAGFAAAIRAHGFELKTLVCFRPQVDFVIASYLQQVKSARLDWRLGLEDYIREAISKDIFGKKWNWLAVADRLAAAVGTETLQVMWYPAVLRRGHDAIVEDFFAWLGLPMPADYASGGVSNPSPNPEALMILRMMNAAGLGGKRFADDFLVRAHEAALLDKRPLLDRKTYELVEEMTLRDNLEMLRRFLPEQSEAGERDLPATVGNTGAGLRKAVFAGMLRIAGETLESD